MLRIFRLATSCFGLAAAVAAAAEGPSAEAVKGARVADTICFSHVDVAPTKTSIYIGTVSLTVPPLTRSGAAYSSTYRARVFPLFFFGEHGKLSIVIPDADLHRLVNGEVVQFTGRAVSSAGEQRRIEGRAVPAGPGADHGRIKIRVWAGKIELIFNSVYRFSATG